MTLLDHFKVFLNIFYWTGIAPFPPLDRKQISYKFIISVIVLFLINIGLVVSTFIFQIYKSYGNIEIVVNYAFVGSLALSNISASFQCYQYKSVYSQIINQILIMENKLNIKCSQQSAYQTVANQYRLKVFIITTLLFIASSLQLAELVVQNQYEFSIILSLTILSQIISAIGLFHILLYVCIVHMFISDLNRRMKSAPNSFYLNTKIEFLKSIKIAHMDVWKLMVHINKYFSWNLPFLVVHMAVQTTFYFYWVFLILQVEFNLLYTAGKISNIFMFVVRKI